VNFGDLKLLYVLSCIALCLVILSPSLATVVTFSDGERFSELWILGPDHMAESYPFSVSAGKSYRVYLGVGNHMGGLEYYSVYVKFRNQSEPLPDSVNAVPSVLEPVFGYSVFLRDNATWEKEILFSFDGVSFKGNVSKVSRVLIDGYAVDVDKVAVWDEANTGFYYQLFFELWIYNVTTSSFQFHNRFVGFWLNMTRQA